MIHPISRRIFIQFLILGCLAFGGPIAHLAWFERTFVDRLKWLTHDQLINLIALCQALPGPASSQVAMSIGYLRGGWKGFWSAWIGFTLPPAVLMIGAAYGALALPDSVRLNLVHGLKVAVVSVVAVALWRMARSLITNPAQIVMVAIFGGFFLITGNPWVVLLTIGLIVLVSLHEERIQGFGEKFKIQEKGRTLLLLAALPAGFLGLELLHALVDSPWAAIPAAFYQTGMLVFGGGHVVLPLLENLVVQSQWVSQESFLFGYGITQMIPGPLFSFAAYLGASFPVNDSFRVLAGLLALGSIYLPSFLLLAVFLPGWHSGRASPVWSAVLANLHPLVIGLLLATWVHPVMTSAIAGWIDALAAVLLGLVIFRSSRLTLPAIALTAGIYVASGL